MVTMKDVLKRNVAKPALPSEKDIQKSLIRWLRLEHPEIAPMIFHIANEGRRPVYYTCMLKEMGLRSGVSDLFVAVPMQPYHGFWLELKSAKGKLSLVQQEFLEDMSEKGYFTAVCYSLEDAVTTLKKYLNI